MKQPDSRRLKFWISSIEGSEEFSIEAHEIEKTVFGVPLLDRQWLWPFNHLSDIVLSHKTGPVDLILGVQYSRLHASLPRRRFLGIRHPFLPHERLLNRKINSFPIVRKYQLVITCRLSEIQSALLKSKC